MLDFVRTTHIKTLALPSPGKNGWGNLSHDTSILVRDVLRAAQEKGTLQSLALPNHTHDFTDQFSKIHNEIGWGKDQFPSIVFLNLNGCTWLNDKNHKCLEKTKKIFPNLKKLSVKGIDTTLLLQDIKIAVQRKGKFLIFS